MMAARTRTTTTLQIHSRMRSSQWAPDAERLYERVQPIKTGTFNTSSLWVAKPRRRRNPDAVALCTCSTTSNYNGTTATVTFCTCDHVAIKSTAFDDRNEEALIHAKREVCILLELDHTNIIQVVREFPYQNSPVFTVALTLASGPTLQQIVDYGGATGNPFVQCVAKQFLSALAYLHSQAVAHRSIRPNHIIVTRGIHHHHLDDDAIWCDDPDNPQVQQMLPQLHIMLVGFSSAIALASDDMKQKKGQDGPSRPNMVELYSVRATVFMSLNEKLLDDNNYYSNGSSSNNQHLDFSSRGNLNYDAPELIRTASDMPNTKPFYGYYYLTADAFSLGAVLRYMLTGVPPELAIKEYIAQQTHFGEWLANYLVSKIHLLSCRPKTTSVMVRNLEPHPNQPRQRKKRFKKDVDVPKDAANLVQSLTIRNVQKRLTVRHAQCHCWIQLKNEKDASVFEPPRFLNFLRFSKIVEGLEEEEDGASCTLNNHNDIP